jgi:hypothetical protein
VSLNVNILLRIVYLVCSPHFLQCTKRRFSRVLAPPVNRAAHRLSRVSLGARRAQCRGAQQHAAPRGARLCSQIIGHIANLLSALNRKRKSKVIREDILIVKRKMSVSYGQSFGGMW